MAELLQTIAAYVPPNIIQDTLAHPNPTAPTEAMSGYIKGAILFADVSGFTPLTEALAQKGAEGPEELTRLLNGYFSRMIALIEAEGGEVVKFSGDAVTVVFPVRQGESLGHATRRAKQAAEAMQAAMSEFTTLKTSVGSVALGMKIGVSAGEILTAQVGGVFNRWEYVIAGDPLRQVAEAEHQAERGDIVLSPEAQALLHPTSLSPIALSQPDWSTISHPEQIETVLRSYVPGSVMTWLGGELHDWLAILRRMSVLFIGVGGLDYAQPDAIERLHAFLRSAQEIIYSLEGSINKLAVDDKGTIFIALFGAPPYAHEDDPQRAVECAIKLQEMAHSQNLSLAVGVTTGRVFAGPVGSETRREYTVMGDTVNLAARLMGKAGLGEIRCDTDTYRFAKNKLHFETLPPVELKGKSGLIPLYKPLDKLKTDSETTLGHGILVGRKKEVALFKSCLDDILRKKSRTLIIEGEAGIGKSRLVEELQRQAKHRDILVLLGMGRSIEQKTPYRAWRDIFTTFFGLDEVDDQTARREIIAKQVEKLAPDLTKRMPLLNDLLNIGFPENTLTSSLDTELRHESLVSLLLTLLRTWATTHPLMIILEDAHWLDNLSWDLALQVVRALNVARVPLFLVIPMRPMEGDAMRIEAVALKGLEQTETLSLDFLPPEDIISLATVRLGVTSGSLPQEVINLVHQQAGGNPFFAEELVYNLRDNNLISLIHEGGWTRCEVSETFAKMEQTLPGTIQGIVLSRIDRLPPEEQLTLKVAAVIGRTFSYPTLYETLENHTELSERMLRIYLDDLRSLNLTPMEAPEPELTYIFKHIITQEVAYETLLFAQRRQLHRTVAEWYHRKFGEGSVADPPEMGLAPSQDSPLASYYPLLAYHWHQAEDERWERHYAWLAGQRAATQFANDDAASYFGRALALTDENDIEAKYQLLLAREAVNDLRGEREAQAEDLAALTELAQHAQNTAWQTTIALRQANYGEITSDYPAALAAAQQSVALAQMQQDQTSEAEGYIEWGKALWRQGEYEAAREQLNLALDPARAMEHRYNEAQSMYYLGHSYLYQDNHASAKIHYQQALKIYQTIGHRQGEADSLNMIGIIHYELGDLPAARDHYEQILTIFQTTGDRRGETMALGNLGNVYCDLGDFATSRDYQEKSLDLRQTIGDPQGEAISHTNLGLVYNNLGEFHTARQQCKQALTIQREIGDRPTEGYSLTYLGHALTGLGDLEAAKTAYEEAMNLRRELGEQSAAIDDVAGLARIALAGDFPQALTYTEEILAWLAEHGTGGIEYPLQVYLTCYQTLQATSEDQPDPRAETILAQAHTTLMKQANDISDPELRQSFLENVSYNREILQAWQNSVDHDLG